MTHLVWSGRVLSRQRSLYGECCAPFSLRMEQGTRPNFPPLHMENFDALDQGGADGSGESDIGADLDPVTDPAAEQAGHTADDQKVTPVAPKAAPEKPKAEPGAAQPTNAEAKQKRTQQKKEQISQEEWQQMTETVENVSQENAALRHRVERSEFERDNPIVRTEKYKQKWDEICALKSDPNHKYSSLDFNDLLQLIRDPTVNEEATEAIEKSKERPVSPPIFTGGVAPKAPGGIDPEAYQLLKSQGYSDEMIANSGPIDSLV